MFNHLFILTEGSFVNVREELAGAGPIAVFAFGLKWAPFLLTLCALLFSYLSWRVVEIAGCGAVRGFIEVKYPRVFQVYKFFNRK
jgi:hypothetical protein